MIRFLFLVILLLCGLLGFAWYSAQTLPSWYQSDQVQEEQILDQLGKEIEQKGVGEFLGSKIVEVLSGKLTLSETEFNALLLASLNSSKDGRLLLSVCDAVNADLLDDRLELGFILNLEKVVKLDAKTSAAVQKIKGIFPLLDDSQLFVAIEGQPIALDGNLAFADSLSLKLGGIPIPNSLLKEMGLPLEKATKESLPIEYMSVKSVAISPNQITLGVLPRF